MNSTCSNNTTTTFQVLENTFACAQQHGGDWIVFGGMLQPYQVRWRLHLPKASPFMLQLFPYKNSCLVAISSPMNSNMVVLHVTPFGDAHILVHSHIKVVDALIARYANVVCYQTSKAVFCREQLGLVSLGQNQTAMTKLDSNMGHVKCLYYVQPEICVVCTEAQIAPQLRLLRWHNLCTGQTLTFNDNLELCQSFTPASQVDDDELQDYVPVPDCKKRKRSTGSWYYNQMQPSAKRRRWYIAE